MNHVHEDILLKYAFDLLDESQRHQTAEHLDECSDCRNRLEQIQQQFAVLDALDENAALSETLMQKTLTIKTIGTKTIPFYRKRWIPWAAAAAVVLIASAMVLNWPDSSVKNIGIESAPVESPVAKLAPEGTVETPAATSPAQHSDAEILSMAEAERQIQQVKRLDLSSVLEPPFAPASAIELVVLPRPDKTQVTIYNSADLTLVRDTRKLTLKPGWNWLQFMWDGTLIDPTSLSLTPLEHADKIDIQQLSYPARLKDVGRWLMFSGVEGAVPFEITYFASGLSWRAFYMGTMNENETSMTLKGYVNVANNSGQDFENAQTRLIVGETRLLEQIPYLAQRYYPYGPDLPGSAGEINYPRNWKAISEDEIYWGRFGRRSGETTTDFFSVNGDLGDGFGGGGYGFKYEIKQIEKEGLSEYFLYTIEDTEDLPNTWAKRLPSFDVADIPVKSLYKYDEDRYGSDTVRFVSFANDTEHELGTTPIPEGSVKIYRTVNAAQNLSYVGAADVKYIPVNEDVELNLGPARLVKVEPVLMQTQTDNYTFDDKRNITGWDEIETWQLKLTNTCDIPVDIEITRNFGTDYWDINVNNSENVEYKKHDKNHARFTLTLPAHSERSFSYIVTKYEGARSEYYIKQLQEQQKPVMKNIEEDTMPAAVDEAIPNDYFEEQPKEELPVNITHYLDLPESPQTEKQLAQPADFSFLQEDTGLEDALVKIAQLTDPPLSMVVMWHDLDQNALIYKDIPIHLSIDQTIPISSGLERVIDAVCDEAVEPIHYFIEDDVIVVASNIPQVRYYFDRDRDALRTMPTALKQQISLANLIKHTTLRSAFSQIASETKPPLSINVLWQDLTGNAIISPNLLTDFSAYNLPPISADFALRLLLCDVSSSGFEFLDYIYNDKGIIIATHDTLMKMTGKAEQDESF